MPTRWLASESTARSRAARSSDAPSGKTGTKESRERRVPPHQAMPQRTSRTPGIGPRRTRREAIIEILAARAGLASRRG
jgi:hypothetical protein